MHLATVQKNILTDCGFQPALGMRVLDLGCGNGELVREWLDHGYEAYGCDFDFKDGDQVSILVGEGRVRKIECPYRLPFTDAYFDLIVTNQVMEHVSDYPLTLAEMRRVLKPDGSTLHIFPSRYVPIEPHVFVPLATVFRSPLWLKLWAWIGIRNVYQRGLDWRSVAKRNQEYLNLSTNYLTRHQLRIEFSRQFRDVKEVETLFLKHSPNAKGRALFQMGNRLPFLFYLYRTFWSRVIVTRA
jgi:ubiquinone/menaquinone biosynthesis C-methylase UbiE